MHQECSGHIHPRSESCDITLARSSFSGRRCFFPRQMRERTNLDARYARQLDFDRHVWWQPQSWFPGRISPISVASEETQHWNSTGEGRGKIYMYIQRRDISVQMKQDRWRCDRLIKLVYARWALKVKETFYHTYVIVKVISCANHWWFRTVIIHANKEVEEIRTLFIQ